MSRTHDALRVVPFQLSVSRFGDRELSDYATSAILHGSDSLFLLEGLVRFGLRLLARVRIRFGLPSPSSDSVWTQIRFWF